MRIPQSSTLESEVYDVVKKLVKCWAIDEQNNED